MIKHALFILSLLSSSHCAFAQTYTQVNGLYTQGNPNDAASTTAASAAATRAAATSAASYRSGGTQNQAASNASNSNNSAATIAKVVGIGMTAYGAYLPTTCQPGCTCCAQAAVMIFMGLASLAQSGVNKGAAETQTNNCSLSAAQAGACGGGGPGGTTTPPTPFNVDNETPSGSAGFLTPTQQASLRNLGISVSPDGKKITLPDGKSIYSSQLGSAASLANSGVTPEQLKASLDKAAQLEKDASSKIGASTASNGFAEGGGGALAAVKNPEDNFANAQKAALREALRDPASTQGLSKNLNGDLIGVASDDIFIMMNRRYQAEDRKGSFSP